MFSHFSSTQAFKIGYSINAKDKAWKWNKYFYFRNMYSIFLWFKYIHINNIHIHKGLWNNECTVSKSSKFMYKLFPNCLGCLLPYWLCHNIIFFYLKSNKRTWKYSFFFSKKAYCNKTTKITKIRLVISIKNYLRIAFY